MAQRIEWFDFAKGLSVAIVVFFHTSIQLGSYDLLPSAYWGLNELLTPMTLSMFFAISAILTGDLTSKPWGDIWRRRIAVFGLLFTIWTIIQLVARTSLPFLPTPEIRSWFGFLIWPVSVLWFIWAWVLFVIVAKLTPVSWRVPVSAAACVIAALNFTGVVQFEYFAHNNLLRFLPFFLIANFYKGQILSLLQRAPLRVILASTPIFLGAFALRWYGASELVGGFARLLQTASGVLFGLSASVFLVKLPLLPQLFNYFGRSTLAIYVAHWLIIATLCAAFASSGFASQTLGYIAAPVITLLGIFASIGLKVAAAKLNANWLFAPTLPQWADRRPGWLPFTRDRLLGDRVPSRTARRDGNPDRSVPRAQP